MTQSKQSIKRPPHFDLEAGEAAVEQFVKEISGLSDEELAKRIAQVVSRDATKTADGMPVMPGMYVYRAVSANTLMRRRVDIVTLGGFFAMHGTFRGAVQTFFYANRFYSTPEAAFDNAEVP